MSEVEEEEDLEENVSLSEDEKRIGWSLVGLTLLDAPGCVACVEDLFVVVLALCFLCFLWVVLVARGDGRVEMEESEASEMECLLMSWQWGVGLSVGSVKGFGKAVGERCTS